MGGTWERDSSQPAKNKLNHLGETRRSRSLKGGAEASEHAPAEAPYSSRKDAPSPFDRNGILHGAHRSPAPPSGTRSIELYDLKGRMLQRRKPQARGSGKVEARIDGTELAPGPYLMLVRTDKSLYRRKVVKE
jgi:hypothetical protein